MRKPFLVALVISVICYFLLIGKQHVQHTVVPHLSVVQSSSHCGPKGVYNPTTQRCVCMEGVSGELCDVCTEEQPHSDQYMLDHRETLYDSVYTYTFPKCGNCYNRTACSNHGCFSRGYCFCDDGYSGRTCSECAPLHTKLYSNVCVAKRTGEHDGPSAADVSTAYSCEQEDFRNAYESHGGSINYAQLRRCKFRFACLDITSKDLYFYGSPNGPITTIPLIDYNVHDYNTVGMAPFYPIGVDSKLHVADEDIYWVQEPTFLFRQTLSWHPGHFLYDALLGLFLNIRELGSLVTMDHRIILADDVDLIGFAQYTKLLSTKHPIERKSNLTTMVWNLFREAANNNANNYNRQNPDNISRICFNKLIIGSMSRSVFGFRTVQPQHLTAYREFFQYQLFKDTATTSLRGLYITVIHRTRNRIITNQQEVVKEILSKYPNAIVREVVLERVPIEEQLRIFQYTTIWISAYGGSHANFLFLPRNAAIIEIFGYQCEHKNLRNSKILAEGMGFKYLPLILSRDTYVPPVHEDECQLFQPVNFFVDPALLMPLVVEAYQHTNNN